MEFSIIINKSANFYFFVKNLSEWHFSCRKIYNAEWRKELGAFSADEENALKQFQEIRAKYRSGRTHFERAFFLAENPWKELKKNLPSEEYEIIKQIFNILADKFNILYQKDLPLLEQWQKNLREKINDPILINPITDALNLLYNSSVKETEIKVFLLFSASISTGGGANIDEKSISAEISRYPLRDTNNAIGIIWHETIHLFFEKEYFFPLLIKTLKNDRDAIYLIKEVTVSALFPKGILAQKFFQSERSMIHAKIPPRYIKSILELVESYVNQNKPFDEEYIEKIYLTVGELKGTLK